ncbi:sensor histidine kinase [Acinetobacter higginsii]|uniref:sensor histidine kinase n=1 Tax=Acinetobacter higginsii TaxID=70347 RepID=UPI003463B4CA
MLANSLPSIANSHSSCTAQITSIQVAKANRESQTQHPQTDWQTITLPDHWHQRWPDYTGSAWYKIAWDYHCPPHQYEPITLVINSINMAGEIYLNDERLWQDKSLVEPLSRSWNMPRYWDLLPSALKQGSNTLWIRVVGVATQDPGLGHVILATPEIAIPQYETFIYEQRVLNFFNLSFSLILGLIAFLVWLFRRQEKAFGWFALTSFCWVIIMSNIAIINPPFGLNTLQIARINIVMIFMHAICGCLYAWRFAHQRFPHIERTFLIGFIVVALSAILLPDTALTWFLLLTFICAVFINIANCISFPFIAYKVRQIEAYLLASVFVFFLLIVLHDAYLILSKSSTRAATVAYTAPLMTLFIAIILALRLAKNVKKIEKFNQTLAQNIVEARDELAVSLNTQHQLELENAKLQERIQLAHDLHDGLGGSLVRSMVTVDQSHVNLSNQQFLSMLKLLRDDLRQVIDSGSSTGAKVPDTPLLWGAPLRYRFSQLFDELDISSKWSFPESWQIQPSPLVCLTLLRVAEEALTNILKHSQANSVRFILSFSNDTKLILEIEDNGIGFNVEAVQTAGMSVGLRSMQTRLERLGGTLVIYSKVGKTAIKASLPI